MNATAAKSDDLYSCTKFLFCGIVILESWLRIVHERDV